MQWQLSSSAMSVFPVYYFGILGRHLSSLHLQSADATSWLDIVFGLKILADVIQSPLPPSSYSPSPQNASEATSALAYTSLISAVVNMSSLATVHIWFGSPLSHAFPLFPLFPQSATEAVSAASQVHPVLLVLDATTLPWRHALLSACPTIKACIQMDSLTASSHPPPPRSLAPRGTSHTLTAPTHSTHASSGTIQGPLGGGAVRANAGAVGVAAMQAAGRATVATCRACGRQEQQNKEGSVVSCHRGDPCAPSATSAPPCWTMADVVAVGRECGRMKVIAARMRRRMETRLRMRGDAAGGQAGPEVQGSGEESEWRRSSSADSRHEDAGRHMRDESSARACMMHCTSSQQLDQVYGGSSSEWGCDASETWQQLQLRTNHQGVAIICFTSGSTGRPKGAAISHTSLLTQSMAKLMAVGYAREDVFLHAAPLCHIGGISSLHAMLMAGGTSIVLPRYSPPLLPSLIASHAVTALIAVPAMLSDMLAVSKDPLPSVRKLLIGGGAVSSALMEPVCALFPNALIMTAYGMTEAASSITFHTLAPDPLSPPATLPVHAATSASSPPSPLSLYRTAIGPLQHPSSSSSDSLPTPAPAVGTCVGLPPPHIEVRVVPLPDAAPLMLPPIDSPASSPSVGNNYHAPPTPMSHSMQAALPTPSSSSSSSPSFPPIVIGEVQTRGPHVMQGYWNRASETAAVLSADGWFSTGDVGWMDVRGRLWLMGRCKEMIKSGGENVFCAEVEAVLSQHPAVAAVAVVGLPHDRFGEEVAALVQLRPGWVWRRESDWVSASDSRSEKDDQSKPVAMSIGVVSRGGPVSQEVLRQFCATKGLSRYKLPRLVCPLQEGQVMPLTATGKIQRKSVHDILSKAQLLGVYKAPSRM